MFYIKVIAGLAILTLCLPGPGALASERTLATEWNEAVLEIAEAEDGFLTLKGLRTVTIMHLAMHDALNAINGRYEAYAFEGSFPEANPVVAAAQAAYVVAADQYPGEAERLAAIRDKWVVEMPAGESVQAGRQLGNSAARAVLADRAGDGWDGEAEYRWHPMAPGVYAEFQEHSDTPQGFIFGAGWAKARGFALERPDQFRVPPPPEISSDAYTEAFNEV